MGRSFVDFVGTATLAVGITAISAAMIPVVTWLERQHTFKEWRRGFYYLFSTAFGLFLGFSTSALLSGVIIISWSIPFREPAEMVTRAIFATLSVVTCPLSVQYAFSTIEPNIYQTTVREQTSL